MPTQRRAADGIRIEWLPIPTALGGADGADYAVAATLEDEAAADVIGHRDFCEGPEWRLARAQPSDYGVELRCVARDASSGGRIAGTAVVWLPLAENTDMAIVNVAVDPPHRRRGIGTALFAAAELESVKRGRTKMNSWVDYPVPPLPGREDGGAGVDGSVVPTKGDGALPADSPTTLFALHLGMELRQIERVSRLAVESSRATVSRLEGEAGQAAGEAYDVVGWVGAVPDEAVEDYCRMLEQMDTDTPAGGLEWEPSVWNEARLRVAEERQARRGSFSVHTCAVHRETGELVAFTALEVVRDSVEAAFQQDTLVLERHRGRRLGLLVKTVNYRRLLGAWPTTRRIYTWNAEENEYMLAINVAMGFRAAHSEGAWEKKCEISPDSACHNGPGNC